MLLFERLILGCVLCSYNGRSFAHPEAVSSINGTSSILKPSFKKINLINKHCHLSALIKAVSGSAAIPRGVCIPRRQNHLQRSHISGVSPLKCVFPQ